MKFRFLLVVAAAWLALSLVPCFADSPSFAEKIRTKAEQGNAEAQVILGTMYFLGDDVTQNYDEAVKWCRKSAEQGHYLAQYFLGRMYREGKGVPRDYAKAVQWYRQAAEQGFDPAQAILGAMYYLVVRQRCSDG